jgi:hypothetical protein
MPYLLTILITLLLAVPAMSVELFRYRGAARDGGTLEYVFDAGEQNSPNAVTKEKAAEIAADFMTTFYHVQVGALEITGISDNARPFLARLLFGHDQGTDAPDIFSSFCCRMGLLSCRGSRSGCRAAGGRGGQFAPIRF